jgi:hypothetical protein
MVDAFHILGNGATKPTLASGVVVAVARHGGRIWKETTLSDFSQKLKGKVFSLL